MRTGESAAIAAALGSPVLSAQPLAGGFSHETWLFKLADRQVVVRLGGPDPAIEAAIMAAAGRHVPVPQVLHLLPATAMPDEARPAMVIEYVDGTLLSHVLGDATLDSSALTALGTEVGRVVAGISRVRFDQPGFFTDARLTVGPERPWSQQLPEIVDACLAVTAPARLDEATQQAWRDLCVTHAPALAAVDGHSRLVHGDVNPKNILVTRTGSGWRVDAVLDWEFSYAGCPYGDAANMMRFGTDYPAPYLDGFRTAFAAHLPADLPPVEDWAYLGRVLDMFALSDLITRPAENPVADQAATQIRRWVAEGLPDDPARLTGLPPGANHPVRTGWRKNEA
ncbi:phosphotransferase [Micromonospora sp. NPDC003197]